MSAALLSIGTATPQGVLRQSDAAVFAASLMELPDRRARALSALYEQSGVETRRTAIAQGGESMLFAPSERSGPDGPGTCTRVDWYSKLAPGLAEAACRDGLRRANVDAGQVTHLITVSCTGFRAPGVDVELIRRLALPVTVQRTHIGFMGCHGAINGLRVAAAIANSDPTAIVMMCCVELCSVHFPYRPHNGAATASALFSDGAAACVVADRGGGVQLSRFGSMLFDDSLDDMVWRIGDHGFEMSLSVRVPRLLRDRIGPWVDAWLNTIGMTRDNVGAWAIHPGGPRIIEAARASLELQDDGIAESLEVLRTHGNMSSPTVLFIVRRLLCGRARLPIVALAFGPGLTGEAMLIEA